MHCSTIVAFGLFNNPNSVKSFFSYFFLRICINKLAFYACFWISGKSLRNEKSVLGIKFETERGWVKFFAGLLEIKCLIDTIQNTIFGKLLDGKHTMKCRYRKYMCKMVTCIRIMFYMHLLHLYLMEKMLSMALCPPILFPVTKDMDQGTFCIHSVYIYRVYLCIHLYFSSHFDKSHFKLYH